ncbi:hypothetical protein RDI58_022312 [Solanum bulbocastanum]|uniref:Uncharacterized protein n=1 Tax=Solanum bulbocastanum TaxID=147425 RepID=A0AAN8T934_SOLBU
MGSVRVTAEKRNLIDQTNIMLETLISKSEKDIRHNFTYGGSIKGSIVRGSVENRTMVGNNKGLKAATFNQNVFVQKTNVAPLGCDALEDATSFPSDNLEKNNVVPPGFDALEDTTSFPSDNLEVMQGTVRSKPAKENGQIMTYVCSIKGTHNKNLMQPGFDPVEVDTFFPRDDLEVMGRGNKFTSLSSNAIPQKTYVVCPDFNAIEVETLFPHDDHDTMQDNIRSKPSKENRKNITSVGSARGSTFVQRTSIGESKGYSVVSSYLNV